MKNVVRIMGTIDEEVAMRFVNETDEIIESYCEYLDQVELVKEDLVQPFPIITVEISSQGGSVAYGSVILDRIEELQMMGIQVDTFCRGVAYSMAFIIFLMGEKRYGGQWSTYMNHASAGHQEGYICDMRNNIDFMQKMDDKFDELILEKTKITKKRLDKARLTCDWIDFEEAIELNIINVFEEEKENENHRDEEEK